MQTDRYLGIEKEFTSAHKQSGSKFLGFLFPISSITDFEKRVKELREAYADATHVCSACVIEQDRSYQRFSDDGEPSNSAGRPILNMLLSSEITFVGCAVVRYYGGKKLGIPGLIEAYGQTTNDCILIAKKRMLTLQSHFKCTINDSYSYMLYNYLAKKKGVKYKVNDGVFTISCAQSVTSKLLIELKKMNTLAVIDEL